MYWILHDILEKEPFFGKIVSFLKNMDIPFEIISTEPFTAKMKTIPNPTQEKVVSLGSYSFTNKIKTMWSPGSWTNENYDYQVWSKKWAGFCLNDDALVCKFGEVPFQRNDFFIRPCADDKLFTGQVMKWEGFDSWREKVLKVNLISPLDINFDSMIMISSVKEIITEYRFLIVNGKIITGSQYKSGNIVSYKEVKPYEEKLFNFVKKVVDVWTPSEAFALDIALADNGKELKYYVLEMGNVNSAGLYDCDIQKFVMAIENMET